MKAEKKEFTQWPEVRNVTDGQNIVKIENEYNVLGNMEVIEF